MSRTHRRPPHRMTESKDKVRDGTPTRVSHRCENNGGCPYCEEGRMHKHKKWM